MKNYVILFTFIAILGSISATAQPFTLEYRPYAYAENPPTLYELAHADYQGPQFWPLRIIYENPQKAGRFYDVAGFSLLVAGGYLLGKAEHHSRFHGTTGNYDNFHLTRDAGMIVTGFGAASLGMASACNVIDGRKGTWLKILNRAVFGLIVSRITSEATYKAMPCRY